MDQLETITVLIPSYNPSDSLIKVIKDVKNQGLNDIIIINDGSESPRLKIFEEAASITGCAVINLEKNCGKGKALKTGMAYFLENRPKSAGVVTIDDDGQHLPDDVLSCAKAMLESGEFVLGVRDFNDPSVPPKSRMGNKTMRFMFKAATGQEISDTQTGLRAIPKKCVNHLLNAPGDRFEYETRSLLAIKEQGFPVMQVPIKTVYIDGNRGTHFRPLADSVKVLLQFGKYITGSLLSFAIDFFGFLTLVSIIGKMYSPDSWNVIFISTVIARVVSSIFNFIFNKNIVFKHKGGNVRAAILRYLALWCFSLIMSSQLVALVSKMPIINTAGLVAVVKIFIDTGLFVFNYYIQRKWVFK